jgi:hypothetical protein
VTGPEKAPVVKGGVLADLIAMAPALDDELGFLQRVELPPLRSSSKNFALKLSQLTFAHGLPGSI